MVANYETREFTVEQLEEMEIECGGPSVILDEITDHGRWDVIHTVVFFFEGKFYEVTYSSPATEMQETDTWGGNPVTAKVVTPKSVTTVSFVPVTKRG